MHFIFYIFLGAYLVGGLVAAAVAAFFCVLGNDEKGLVWKPIAAGFGWPAFAFRPAFFLLKIAGKICLRRMRSR